MTPDTPTMIDYLARHHAYQQFVALALLLALLLAYFLNKQKGHGWFIMPPLWLLLVLALVVRLPLMNQSMWYDENFTSLVVRGSWSQFFSIVATDVHPPGYYFVVRLFVMVFGHNELAMRLPALLTGLLLVRLMWHWYGDWQALLVAILPAAVYYSTEARYPEALALVLLIAYTSIHSHWYWRASAALAIAATFHVNAWFYVVLMCLWLVRVRWWYVLPPAVAVLVWFPFALVQAQDVGDGFWLQQSIPVRVFHDMTIGGRFGELAPAWVLLFSVTTLTIFAAAIWRWRKHVGWLWLAMVFGVPFVQWLVGLVWQPIYLDRTMLFSAILLLIPAGYYFAWYAPRVVPVALVVCLMAANFSMYQLDRSPADDIVSQCGDRIVYAGTTFSAIVASHYSDTVVLWRDGETTAQSMAEDVRQSVWLLTDFTRLPDEYCFFTVVDSFTSQQQVDHFHRLVNEPEYPEVNKYAYYMFEVR